MNERLNVGLLDAKEELFRLGVIVTEKVIWLYAINSVPWTQGHVCIVFVLGRSPPCFEPSVEMIEVVAHIGWVKRGFVGYF